MGFFSKWFGGQQPREIPKLGRNDPCWCGSGKKYKRCHMDSDARKHSQAMGAGCVSRG